MEVRARELEATTLGVKMGRRPIPDTPDRLEQKVQAKKANNAKQQKRRAERYALGLCATCAEPTKETKQRGAKPARLCPKHLAIERKQTSMRRYNMTHDEFEALQALRKDGCMICGEKERDYTLNIDHDHATGAVRGLLCMNCNVMLGWFEKHTKNIQKYLAGQINQSWRENAN